MRFLCEAGFSGVGINLRPFASKVISLSIRFLLDIFLMNFSLAVLSLFLYRFLEALRLVDRFSLVVWVRTGLAREAHIWIQCNSFFFIFMFRKSIYKSCKFADLGFQVINVISLVRLFVGTSVFRSSEVGSARG